MSASGALNEAMVSAKLPLTTESQYLRAIEGIAKTMPGAFYRCAADADNTIIFVSSGIERLCGHPAAEFNEHRLTWDDIIHPDDIEYVVRASGDAETQNGPLNIEYRFVHRDGTVRWVMERSIHEFGDDGSIAGYAGVILDISERKAAEHKLVEARRAAEEANRTKSKFLALMSHEIRTPLYGLMGSLDLLDVPGAEDRNPEFLAIAKTSASALLEIVNDILDFSKMEAGKLDVEPCAFAVSDVLHEALATMEVRAAGKGVALEREIDETAPARIIGDPLRVMQVLRNLLSNALNFTSSGCVRLAMTCTQRGDDACRIRFEVEDSGAGIADQDKSHVFEEFWTTGADGNERAGGTGLGLTISRHIVEMMSGSMGFESQLGVGSRFWFEVPFGIASGAAADSERDPAAAGAGDRAPHPAGLAGRVLVAEDSPTNQLVTRTMLERMGLEVTMVYDGVQAVEAVASGTFDVVLMDIGMPKMDGIEAMNKIRGLPRGASRVPVLAMTAHALHGEHQRLLRSGFDDYIKKPVDRARLRSALARWLPVRADATA